ncbi:MAG TPA: DNA methyltransferase [Pirellulales bacterium]|nr:DNA methyltransferase [Pirellulales bacterium]
MAKRWKVEAGQVWTIAGEQGEHRLLCGDSTKNEDVARLMGAERAGLMNTDPPYGIDYRNETRPLPNSKKSRKPKQPILNDDANGDRLQTFLESCFRAAIACALKEKAAWYLWHAHLTQGFFAAAAAAAAAANVVLHRQIIWVKRNMLLGRGQYHWKHEPCFFGWVKGHQPPDYGLGQGERTQTTVWEIASVPHNEREELDHPTPKPVELFAIPIVKHLLPGEICFEPFAGTGPQLLAAEQLGRRCFAIEILPQYCAVILERAAKFGLEPRLAESAA